MVDFSMFLWRKIKWKAVLVIKKIFIFVFKSINLKSQFLSHLNHDY